MRKYKKEDAVKWFNGSDMPRQIKTDAVSCGFPVPDFTDVSNILIGKFVYKEHECEIRMDAVDAKISYIIDGVTVFTDNMSGRIGDNFVRIGPEGIKYEYEYTRVFTTIYKHLTDGLYFWVQDITARIDNVPLSEKKLFGDDVLSKIKIA